MNMEQKLPETGSGLGASLLELAAVLLVLAVLLTSGCTSDGETNLPTPPTPGSGVFLEGRVADGYLEDALVFLDINGNKLPDPGEPQTSTGSGGRFSLEVGPGQEQLYPVVVRVIKSRSIDEDGWAVVPYDYTLETPIGRHGFISPLTTLIKQELDKNHSFRETDAVNLVRTRFGLDDNLSLWQDYLTGEQGPQTAAGCQLAHATAQVLAAFQGRLLDAFQRNLGTLQDEDFLPASRVIGDLQMQHAQEISGILTGIVPAAAKSRDQLVEQLLGGIDLAGLDRQLLNRYRQLIAKHPETWDATPPAIIARQPAEGESVPVGTRIELGFSEALDPASLHEDAVVLRQGNSVGFGMLNYDKNRFLLTLVPDQPLLAYTNYAVEVSPEISDLLGNPIGTTQTWNFQTLFQHSPPTLPDF